MQVLLRQLQSPAFKVMAEIIAHTGTGMTVTRCESFPFATHTVQIWEFTPQTLPLDREAVRVVVNLIGGQLRAWKAITSSFEEVVAKYRVRCEPAPPSGSPPTPEVETPTPVERVFTLSATPEVRFALPPRADGKPWALRSAVEVGP